VKNCKIEDRIYQNSIIKIDGKVLQDGSIEAYQIYPVDDSFDFENYNESLKIIHHHEIKDFFY